MSNVKSFKSMLSILLISVLAVSNVKAANKSAQTEILYIELIDAFKLTLMNVQTGAKQYFGEYPFGTSISCTILSPNGQSFAYVVEEDGQQNIKITSLTQGTTDKLLSSKAIGRAGFFNLSWSPDGRYLAFIADREDMGSRGDLYVIDLKTQTAQAIIQAAYSDITGVAWSKDNRHIIVYGEGLNLLVVDVWAKTYKNITKNALPKQTTAYEPFLLLSNGNKIIFRADYFYRERDDYKQKIYLYMGDWQTGSMHPITEVNLDINTLLWDNDKQNIIFSARTHEFYDYRIFSADIVSGKMEPLTAEYKSIELNDWSQVNRQVIFSASGPDNRETREMYLLNLDDKSITSLGPGDCGIWRPISK